MKNHRKTVRHELHEKPPLETTVGWKPPTAREAEQEAEARRKAATARCRTLERRERLAEASPARRDLCDPKKNCRQPRWCSLLRQQRREDRQ